MEVRIDVNALRNYLLDSFGCAATNGFPAAVIDAFDIETMDGQSLCQLAERKGIDLRRFIIEDD